jgi:hypothetical protein
MSLWRCCGAAGGTAFEAGLNFRVAHLSRRVTGGGFDFGPFVAITAYVPNHATSGPVTVTEAGVTSSGAQFNVIEAATVTGLSPASGPVGASIVITGTGFGPSQSDSTLNFIGATATSITSWSDTSITASVPLGAETGPVFVNVAGQTASGPVFTLTFSVTMTDSLGNSTTYLSENVSGEWQSTDSQGSGCSTCSVRAGGPGFDLEFEGAPSVTLRDRWGF